LNGARHPRDCLFTSLAAKEGRKAWLDAPFFFSIQDKIDKTTLKDNRMQEKQNKVNASFLEFWQDLQDLMRSLFLPSSGKLAQGTEGKAQSSVRLRLKWLYNLKECPTIPSKSAT
jgi:hypothetical protein